MQTAPSTTYESNLTTQHLQGTPRRRPGALDLTQAIFDMRAVPVLHGGHIGIYSALHRYSGIPWIVAHCMQAAHQNFDVCIGQFVVHAVCDNSSLYRVHAVGIQDYICSSSQQQTPYMHISHETVENKVAKTCTGGCPRGVSQMQDQG